MPTFVGRYFETRYVMLSRPSLENLVEISRHRVFSPALKTLEICIDHLAERPDLGRLTGDEGNLVRAIEQGGWSPQNRDRELENRSSEEEGGDFVEEDGQFMDEQNKLEYDLLRKEQQFMMASGLNTAYITRALSSFPHVETVVINNGNRPWGAMAQKRLTGVFPANTMDDLETIEYVEQALPAIFSAIIASQISLRQLDIPLGQLDDEAISPDMLAFPEPYLHFFRNLPESLTSLCLTISPSFRFGSDDRWIATSWAS